MKPALENTWQSGLMRAATDLRLVPASVRQSSSESDTPKLQELSLPDLNEIPDANLNAQTCRYIEERARDIKQWIQGAAAKKFNLKEEFSELEKMKARNPEVVLVPEFVARYQTVKKGLDVLDSVGDEFKRRMEFSGLMHQIKQCAGSETALRAALANALRSGWYRLAADEDITDTNRVDGRCTPSSMAGRPIWCPSKTNRRGMPWEVNLHVP